MTEQELCAIEQRLLGEYKPIDVGDAVEVLDWSMKPIAKGLVTCKKGMYVWMDNDNPASKAGIHVSSICRDEPTQDDDVRALLAEVRQLRAERQKILAICTLDAVYVGNFYKEAVKKIKALLLKVE